MTKPNMFLRVLFAFILAGSIVFAGIAIYRFAKAEIYRNTSDEIYTFSEASGMTAEDEIVKAEYWYYGKDSGIVGPPLGWRKIDPQQLAELKEMLLGLKFVEDPMAEGGNETDTLVLTFSDGNQLTIYTGEYTFSFVKNDTYGFIGDAKRYRAIGASKFYDLDDREEYR